MCGSCGSISGGLCISAAIFLPLIVTTVCKHVNVRTVSTRCVIVGVVFDLMTTCIRYSLVTRRGRGGALEKLVLSPTDALRVLFKGDLLDFVDAVTIVVVTTFLANCGPSGMVVINVTVVLSTIFCVKVNALLKLLAGSMVRTSIIVLPVVVVFSFNSFLAPFVRGCPILVFVRCLPGLRLVSLTGRIRTKTNLSSM